MGRPRAAQPGTARPGPCSADPQKTGPGPARPVYFSWAMPAQSCTAQIYMPTLWIGSLVVSMAREMALHKATSGLTVVTAFTFHRKRRRFNRKMKRPQ